jgi:hypothetical protein
MDVDVSVVVGFTFGEYTVSFNTENTDIVWLSNSDDEGMSLHSPEIERMLHEHFIENF